MDRLPPQPKASTLGINIQVRVRVTELLDAYDDEGRHLGALPRKVVHTDGYWHHVFHCLVVAERVDRMVGILQKRSTCKSTFPGLFDLTATGHLAAGESPIDGRRELVEEVGFDVGAERLVPLVEWTLVDVSGDSEGHNREIIHAFAVRDDRPLAAYAPYQPEVSEVVEIDLIDLLAVVTDGSSSEPLVAEARGLDSAHRVTVNDVIPDIDGYFAVVIEAAMNL